MLLLKRYGQRRRVFPADDGAFSHGLSLVKRFRFQGSFPFQNRLYDKLAILGIRIILHRPNILLGHMLQPNRLPDPRRPGIVAFMGEKKSTLFSPWLRAGSNMILCADRNHIFLPALPVISHIHAERTVSAPMCPHMAPIDINICLIVHCAEMKQQAAALPVFRRFHAFSVPHTIHEILFPDSG